MTLFESIGIYLVLVCATVAAIASALPGEVLGGLYGLALGYLAKNGVEKAKQ